MLLAGLVLGSVVVAVALGNAPVTPAEGVRALGSRLGGGAASHTVADRVVWRLRLPRALLALAVGGGLSVVGVAMQALVRNPLAEPYVLGISGGASAGASLFYLGFLPPLLSRALSLPLAAFLGGLATITVVYLVARTGGPSGGEAARLSVARLLLAGVAMSALMGAVTSFVTLASPEPGKLRAVLFWLLGSLAGTTWARLPLPVLAAVGALGACWAFARPLDAMLLGEEPARTLGVSVEAIKRGIIGGAALVTGLLVASAGAIGFVGLIVPHAVRLMIGAAHRRLVPISFLAGALFLLWTDTLARTLLDGQELPVGILTAACGVPFFLWLLRREQYRFG
jgi:iron complex transport system permease protein